MKTLKESWYYCLGYLTCFSILKQMEYLTIPITWIEIFQLVGLIFVVSFFIFGIWNILASRGR